ncbi:type II toxin-antitoxin system Phd/YefM family antitoxin [Tumidithrix elongata RA019]|uniref:Antitoxin n=1 Tax=Tumidithrix elongata BACA0141 TaxID=2716417 RepID=A0AAW9Q8I0_9CYAN|nr:type II toxin-antitoxin system Phd/YefM family antitoxin [Tumidithrix elongata RA019]
MYQVTVDYAKVNLDELCERAGKEPEGVAIVRENRSYVLITYEEWESLIETAELMKVPNLLKQVEVARQEYQKGEVLNMDQVFG